MPDEAAGPSADLSIVKERAINCLPFDALNPATWGYADPARKVWGLAVSGGRLFVRDQKEIAAFSVAGK